MALTAAEYSRSKGKHVLVILTDNYKLRRSAALKFPPPKGSAGPPRVSGYL
jgi:hypothetical protein